MTAVHTTTGRWKYGLFLTLTAALFWGILPTALKVLVNSMDAYTITWYRLIIAFCILFILLYTKGKLPKIGQIDRKYAVLLIVTCLGLCVNYITFILGIEIIGPAPAQILIQMNAVFVIMGGIFIFRERFVREQVIGLCAIVAGFGLFFHNKLAELLTSITHYSIGVVILLLSAAALASYSLAQKQLLVKFSSLQISMLVFGAGALLLLPVTAGNIAQVADLEWSAIALLLFCVITTLLAFGSYAEALQHWETTKISAVLSTVPLIALAVAELTVYVNPGLFSTDPVTMISVIGAVVLVIGSFLVARKNN